MTQTQAWPPQGSDRSSTRTKFIEIGKRTVYLMVMRDPIKCPITVSLALAKGVPDTKFEQLLETLARSITMRFTTVGIGRESAGVMHALVVSALDNSNDPLYEETLEAALAITRATFEEIQLGNLKD